MNSEQIEKMLSEEELKLREADRLKAMLDSYWFGLFDPRWHSTRKELRKVIKSFRYGSY